jgi:predicted P-loop ATPase
MVDRPPFVSDAVWAEWCAKHGVDPGPSVGAENVVQFDKTRKRKPKARPMPPADRPAWFADLRSDERGRIYPDLRNVMIALRSEPRTTAAFHFDEMQQDPIMITPLPLAPGARPGPPPPRLVTDDDVARLQEWLQYCGLPRIGREIVHQGVDLIARETRVHPIRDWLDGLEWDGVDRLSFWLTTYLGADPAANGMPNGVADPRLAGEAYLAAIGRMFVIAMVARIYQPGCKADYLLVLEGDQGVQKSRACAALAGGWFSDSLPGLDTKDSRQHLRGKWLVEVSELAAFNRSETESLKAYITRTHERYRPVWARKDVTEPRQCLFIGSTNRKTYLKDETGGRRFWPVEVGLIDVERLALDRAQLFAQAVDRYRHGEHWWPDSSVENQYIKAQQDARYEGDPWEERIATHVELRTRVTVTEVATNALGFDSVSRVGTADQRRIANILFQLGWKPGRDYQGRFYGKS